MENKKNTLTIILIIIIAILCCIIGWLLGSKFADVEDDTIDNSNSNIEENIPEKEEEKEINVEEIFSNFTSKKGLNTNKNVYDEESLNNINCIDALNASGSGYSLELYKFSDNENAKKYYTSQNNYQLEYNNVKQNLGTGSTNNYDYYEAILVPNLEMAPNATGNEYNYIYQLRIDNFYIVLYETSTNSDKTSMINISSELKESLGI